MHGIQVPIYSFIKKTHSAPLFLAKQPINKKQQQITRKKTSEKKNNMLFFIKEFLYRKS